MTRQGAGTLAVAIVSLLLGAAAGWPELVILGAVLAFAVGASVLWASIGTGGSLDATPTVLEVPRLARAATRVVVGSGRRFGVVVEDASEASPRRYRSLAWEDKKGRTEIEFGTARRTVGTRGPLRAVRADPFGFSRRILATGPAIELVVTPRLGEVDDDLRTWNPGDDWEAPRSLRKSHLSEQLREYVVGDEPRRIHWRSSARTGTLVVRERVGTESRDTLVFLDTDPNAWQTGSRFDADDSLDNFELGVELATSVVHQLVLARVQVAFLHGQIEHAFFVDRVSRSGFDRKMAEVALQPTLGSAHRQLPGALRTHRFKRIIVITYRPGVDLRASLSSGGRGATVRLITPMPPAAGEHGPIPVESVRWTPSSS